MNDFWELMDCLEKHSLHLSTTCFCTGDKQQQVQLLGEGSTLFIYFVWRKLSLRRADIESADVPNGDKLGLLPIRGPATSRRDNMLCC